MSDTSAPSAPPGLPAEELAALDAHWRAANYLAVGQIYLMANPLLTRPLVPEDIKPRLLGHWGTSPGLNLVHTHLNRVVKARDLSALCVWGPGHGGPAVLANAWLEGSYSATYPDVGRDAEGMGLLFRQFSFPGGVPSHVAPEVPGSIHEGGELGYALAHAYGAALDHPDLLVVCVVGDGEAETGPLAGSWHANKFLDPVHDGAVLPVLHLNGYKIANPTVLARLPEQELDQLLRGYGHDPLYVTGDDPDAVHRALAAAMDTALDRIAAYQRAAREDGTTGRPRWPMIVLRTPKGWTGPEEVDGLPVENTWRSHQVPLSGVRDNPEHLRQLEAWLRSYRPRELFGADGRPTEQVLACVPEGDARLGSTPYANGGLLLRDLPLPSLEDHAVRVDKPGTVLHEPTKVLGGLLESVMAATEGRRDFRVVGPDETASNRLDALYHATGKAWQASTLPTDEHLSRDGRVMEVLSEHLCQGWLEGYLLTGRHGLFSSYEAFAHIVDSMVNQHIKWLRTSRRLPWRRPIASLNYLLTSHVWRQDHNGFSHQDPGFVDHILNKSSAVVRVYLPPDTNTLLSVTDHVLRSRDYVNVVVAGKQPTFDWLTLEEARAHCARGGRDLGVGRDRARRAGAGRRPRLCGRRAHPGDTGRGRPAPPSSARTGRTCGQRGRHRPDDAARGASARHAGRRVRRPVHPREAGDLRVPRLPLADPPARLPPGGPPQPACARLQGGRHHDHAVRHGRTQRPRPLPAGHGRHRPRAGTGRPRCRRTPGDGGRAHPPPRLDPRARHGSSRGRGVAVGRRLTPGSV